MTRSPLIFLYELDEMIGTMERNVGGLLIYSQKDNYYVLDARTCPYQEWGTLPLCFNPWQNLGQLKIFFLTHGR